jgi:hypothetical protein
MSLHSIIQILKNMLVELCVGNYATYDGRANGIDNIFKHQQHIVTKPSYG